MRFLLKPLKALCISGKARGQKFERGLAARCHVCGQIDFTHPTDADPFTNFVMADRAIDEQIGLPIFYNPRRNAGNWGFNESAGPLMRREECFYLTTQNVITVAGL